MDIKKVKKMQVVTTENDLTIVILANDTVWVTVDSYSKRYNIPMKYLEIRLANLHHDNINDLECFTDTTDVDINGNSHILISSNIFARWIIDDCPEYFYKMVDVGSKQYLQQLVVGKTFAPRVIENVNKIVKTYQIDRISHEEHEDGEVWVCLTEIAIGNKPFLLDWLKSGYVKKYLDALKRVKGKEVIDYRSAHEIQVWVLKEIAIEYRRWDSVDVLIKTNQIIANYEN